MFNRVKKKQANKQSEPEKGRQCRLPNSRILWGNRQEPFPPARALDPRLHRSVPDVAPAHTAVVAQRRPASTTAARTDPSAVFSLRDWLLSRPRPSQAPPLKSARSPRTWTCDWPRPHRPSPAIGCAHHRPTPAAGHAPMGGQALGSTTPPTRPCHSTNPFLSTSSVAPPLTLATPTTHHSRCHVAPPTHLSLLLALKFFSVLVQFGVGGSLLQFFSDHTWYSLALTAV